MESQVLRFVRSFDAFDRGKVAKSKSMTVRQAAVEAARLSSHDALHFYRVVPVDEAMTEFRIEKVSKKKEWPRLKLNSSRSFEHVPYSHFRKQPTAKSAVSAPSLTQPASRDLGTRGGSSEIRNKQKFLVLLHFTPPK
jgi:hypothetical protein